MKLARPNLPQGFGVVLYGCAGSKKAPRSEGRFSMDGENPNGHRQMSDSGPNDPLRDLKHIPFDDLYRYFTTKLPGFHCPACGQMMWDITSANTPEGPRYGLLTNVVGYSEGPRGFPSTIIGAVSLICTECGYVAKFSAFVINRWLDNDGKK
jgi:hypothetical protein